MAGPTIKLDLRQRQSLVMTPQLQQSMKILQYSSEELNEYVDQELEKNPLLERSEPGAEEPSEPVAAESESDDEGTEQAAVPEVNANDALHEEKEDSRENSWGDEPESNLYYENTRDGGHTGDDPEYWDKLASREETLKEYLQDQVAVELMSPSERMIALYLIDMLDESGYLPTEGKSLTDIAANLGCDVIEVEDTLELLQTFDPPGVFARSLKECLALQLHQQGSLDSAMSTLLENLDLLAKGDLAKLRKLCGVGESKLQALCEEIKSLNPKPGNSFSSEVAQVIQPDVFVRKKQNGNWMVELNNETLPRVLVNRKYYSMVKQRSKDSNEKQYLAEQFQTANWLLNALNQRAERILQVATILVEEQQEFFERGVRYLKPMTMRALADKLEIHESTVGRVVNNKYMLTPRGQFEMKFLFSSSVQADEGEEDVSSHAVKDIIQELIDNEASGTILSDDKLAEILQSRGINVARRTVTKYREAMHIGSSVERRRQKRLQA